MRNIGFIEFNHIIEKVNREKPSAERYKISNAKEWVWEAVTKIGGETSYVRERIDLDISGGRVLLPSKIRYIKEVMTIEGAPMIETRESFLDGREDTLKYMINGNYLYTNATSEKLSIECLQFPTDSKGNPLVVDNEYVIQGVVSYILERIARRMWIDDRMQDSKYRMVEQEWLFYVGAAARSLDMPSLDGMKEWRFLHNMFPIVDDEIATRTRTVGGYENPPYITLD